MRIAINASILGEKPSGLGVHTYNMLKELSKIVDKDDDITVFTSGYENLKNFGFKIRKITKLVMPNYSWLSGIMRFLWNQFVFPFSVVGKFDIIYSPTHHTTLLKKNQIITIHDLLALRFPRQHRLQSIFYKYFLPILAGKSRMIITDSESSKKDIMGFYGINEDKIKVIYCGYDNLHFNKRENAAEYMMKKFNIEKYILVIGTTYPHKNIEKAIESYFILKTDCKMLIAGIGGKKYIKKLKMLVQKLKLTERVIFWDYVAYNDLPFLYSSAEMLCFPSLYEGFGLPLLEAMACGCPVITSKISSIPEVCGDTACYIDPESVDDIAAGMQKILEVREYKDKLIKSGLERVKLFSWVKTAREVYNLMLRVYQEYKCKY